MNFSHKLRSALALAALSIGAAACGGHGGSSAFVPGVAGDAAQAARRVTPFAKPGYAITITPNFAGNFGWQAPWIYGTQPVRHGPLATLRGGDVDFGPIIAGFDLRYRSAVEVAVSCPGACSLYTNVDADFRADLPAETMESVPSASQNSYPASLAGAPFYANVPVQIASMASAGKQKYQYDFILRVPEGAAPGSVSTNVVYTVVP